jgi:hypothetical protein
MAHPDMRHISFTYPPVASMLVVTLHNLFCTRTCPYPVTLLSLGSGFFEPNLFPCKYHNISQPSHSTPTCPWRWNTQSVPKHRHIKFRRRELARRKHTTFRTWRKFEIKDTFTTLGSSSSGYWISYCPTTVLNNGYKKSHNRICEMYFIPCQGEKVLNKYFDIFLLYKFYAHRIHQFFF